MFKLPVIHFGVPVPSLCLGEATWEGLIQLGLILFWDETRLMESVIKWGEFCSFVVGIQGKRQAAVQK